MEIGERLDEGKLWKVLKNHIISGINKEDIVRNHIPELSFHYHESPEAPLRHFMRPIFIIIAQGSKFVKIGEKDFIYPEGCFFVSAIDMPLTSCVLTASKDKPYLSLSIELDIGSIAEFVAKSRVTAVREQNATRGATGHRTPPELLDSIIRLIELSRSAADAACLKNNILSEIHYRLVKSEAGEALSALCSMNLPILQIRNIIDWIKENYNHKFTIMDIAEKLEIAPSTIHKYFQAVTSLSPIQYQKLLRLSEARRLLGKGTGKISEIAENVGYESSTQFSREYKRLYGVSPLESRSVFTRNDSYVFFCPPPGAQPCLRKLPLFF